MDAQEQRILGPIDDPDPLPQIGDLLLGNGLTGSVDGGTNHHRIEAQQMEQVVHSQRDLKIEIALAFSRAGDRSPIYPTMPRVDHDSVQSLHGHHF